MKIIVVCLDGTGQVKAQLHPTNIARIFDSLGGQAIDADHGSLETTAAGPPAVLGKYLPGVGTQGDPALKLLGNLFGDGIAEPITRGYTFLSRNYEPGDAIIITGFSRGATAARALAGFVVGHGLLNPATYDSNDKNAAYLRAIVAWYAYRKQRPTLASDARLLVVEGLFGKGLPKLDDNDFIAPPAIKAVAVFDTVSSLGLPHVNSGGDAVFDYSICDTNLSQRVEFGFHALAADEMRDLFGPTFWAKGENVLQHIFSGCHSDVGGGYPNRGLSDAALDWMFGCLHSVGLICNPSLLDPPLAPNPLDIAQDDGATFPFNNTPRRPRQFPESVLLSQAIQTRWGQPTEMLPVSTPAEYVAKGLWADGRPLK